MARLDLFSSGLILSELLDPEAMRVPPCVLIQDCTPGASDPSPQPRSDPSIPENLPDTPDSRRILHPDSTREAAIAAGASEIEKNSGSLCPGWRILHVGGTRYETSDQTLSHDSRSMLAGLLRNEPEKREYWIDRDGRRFQHILNYLRNGTIFVEDLPTLREVQEEAGYYQLQGLEQLCEEKILELQSSQAEERSRRTREMSEALIDALFKEFPRKPAQIRARRLGDPPLAAAPRFDLDADF